MTFAQLSDRAQVHRLRAVAMTALARYPIDVRRLRLLEHGFNTTFRVDAVNGDIFALRIDVNRQKPVGALDAELAWLAALAADSDVVVPEPQPTRDGALHTAVDFEPLGTALNVAVMSWLPGRDMGSPTVDSLQELGRQTAMLHAHARTWQIPAAAEFPRIDSVFMDSTDAVTTGHPSVGDEQRRLFADTLAVIEPLHDAMIAAGERMPIHADLHGWNVKWLRGRMAIFDFDDAGIGVPAQDLAITTYYQRPDPAMRDALLDGYRNIATLPPFTDEQFQATMVARNLLLLNDILDINTAEIRAIIPTFVSNTVLRCRHYLDTGEYVADVPGVRAIE